MSFAGNEISRDLGQPIDLYEFRYGEGENDIFRYTGGEKSLVFRPPGDDIDRTYTAISIWHDEIAASGTLDKSALSVNFAIDASITALFRDRPPSSVVSIIIRQGHANDTAKQFLVNFSGKVIGFSEDNEGNTVKLTCEAIGTSMKRNALRRRWQYSCPLALYGPDCRASEIDATDNFVVLGVSGSILVLPNGWRAEAVRNRYIGGKAKWTLPDGRSEIRTITQVNADSVLLNNRIVGLDPGESISLTFGCPHTMTGCKQHNNIQNFGGDPWIPLKNPVGIKNNYY